MVQAIVTKYHGPTTHRGSRITASSQAGKVTVSWDHAMSAEGNHREAAAALASKLGWEGHWEGGWMPSGDGCAFVRL